MASGRFYRQPPPGFTDHPLLTPRGALIAGHAGQEADLKKAAAEYARLVPSVRWLDPEETLRLQPLLKPEAAAGGAIFEPEADDMDVASIHGGFLKGARAAGAVLRLNAEVLGLENARDHLGPVEARIGGAVDDLAPLVDESSDARVLDSPTLVSRGRPQHALAEIGGGVEVHLVAAGAECLWWIARHVFLARGTYRDG